MASRRVPSRKWSSSGTIGFAVMEPLPTELKEKVLMTRVPLLAAAAGFLLLGGPATADVKSGIEIGESIKAFNPQHVTGPDAGKSSCLV